MITRTDTVRILAPAGEAIPAKSLAEITGYSEANLYFTTQKPSADALAAGKVVIVPEAIPAGEVGLAYYDGIHVVTVSGTVNAGDGLGTKASSWSAQAVASDPILYAMAMVNGDAIARTTGGGGGTGGVSFTFFKIVSNVSGSSGVYNCYEQTYSAAGGLDRLTNTNTTAVQVWNIMEEDAAAESHELPAGAILVAWSQGGGYIGFAPRHALWGPVS